MRARAHKDLVEREQRIETIVTNLDQIEWQREEARRAQEHERQMRARDAEIARVAKDTDKIIRRMQRRVGIGVKKKGQQDGDK